MMAPLDVSDSLKDTLKKNGVVFGGASVGKGLQQAAAYYITKHLANKDVPEHFQMDGAQDLKEGVANDPVEDAFYVCDIGTVISQYWQWCRFFPRVEAFYAVKCNPDPLVVKTLAILGANFDCASRSEFRLVQDVCKDLPRKPEIIYANPCKSKVHLIEAVCRGVKIVTFDNAAEVVKCAQVSDKIQLVLRIITNDKGSKHPLSTKFGAPREKWRPLLAAAKRHGLEVVGVSFHVGSSCYDASIYEMALNDAREIFDMAEREFDYKMTLLDIGGGFPGETYSSWNHADLGSFEGEGAKEGFEAEYADEEEKKDECDVEAKQEENFVFFPEIAKRVSPMLDRLFPKESGIRLIAEPGRYFVAASSAVITSVTSCRDNVADTMIPKEIKEDTGIVFQPITDYNPLQDKFTYYLNEGCYGAFNNLIFDHVTLRARHFRLTPSLSNSVGLKENKGFKTLLADVSPETELRNDTDNSLYASTLFGPTCDSIDVVGRSILLPKLKVGDWLYFQNMGAYTCAAASTFNGFAPAEKFYVCSIMPEYFKDLALGPEAEKIDTNQ